MLSLESVTKRIRERALPVWTLRIKGSAKSYDAYEGENIEDSITALEESISQENANVVFSIELKKTSKSNGAGVLNLDFTSNGDLPIKQNLAGVQNQFAGFGEILPMYQAMDKMKEDKLDAIEVRRAELQSKYDDFRDEKSKFEMRLVTFEIEQKNFEREKKDRIAELEIREAEAAAIINKGVKTAEKIGEKFFKNKIEQFLGLGTETKGLAGTEGTTTTNELSADEIALNEVSEEILKYTQDVKTIQNIGVLAVLYLKSTTPNLFDKLVNFITNGPTPETKN